MTEGNNTRKGSIGTLQLDAGECPLHSSRMALYCTKCDMWVCKVCIETKHQSDPGGTCQVIPIDEALDMMKNTQRERINSSLETLEDMKTKAEEELELIDYKLEAHEEFLNLLKKQKESDLIFQLISDEMAIIDELAKRKKTFTNQQITVKKSKEKIEGLTIDDTDNHSVQEFNSAIQVISCSIDALQRQVKQLQRYLRKKGAAEKFESEILKGLIISNHKRIYALHDVKKDLNKWSVISMHDGCAHVHAMQETQPPPGALELPFCLLKDLLPEEKQLVFLDLKWEGEVQGTVFIELYGEELGEAFIALCTGEDGWCYQNTNFYRSQHLNLPGEIIHGGDLEANDGSGSTGCFDYDYGDIHTRDITEGLVVGWPTPHPWDIGSFSVYLSDNDARDFTAFGQVVRGIETLKKAARLIPSNITDLKGMFCKITEVTVADCGIVIPLKTH